MAVRLSRQNKSDNINFARGVRIKLHVITQTGCGIVQYTDPQDSIARLTEKEWTVREKP